ncbi:MAG: DUF805 domain-containing protein [Candidatus Pacebacteria bacterium]|jgi:uncharacterized membrane protein YhaH (DUF805 family)|nr:DUF805 domain-containing protein [Candidatus Paceibacterota bacterium]
MNYYLEPWKKYGLFSGRARQEEYGIFVLTNSSLIILLILLMKYAAISIESFWGGLIMLFWLAYVIPFYSVTSRRLHDMGHSGWWTFLYFVPLAGQILFIFLIMKDGQQGENKFGPNPKGESKIKTGDLPKNMPLGVALIILILFFSVALSLFSILQEISTISGISDWLNRLLIPVCSALIIFGFLKKMAWSRILFILVSAYLLMQEFLSLATTIRSLEFEREPIGTFVVMGFELLSIAIFVWVIIYVFSKKSYFFNK